MNLLNRKCDIDWAVSFKWIGELIIEWGKNLIGEKKILAVGFWWKILGFFYPKLTGLSGEGWFLLVWVEMIACALVDDLSFSW